MNIKGIEFFKKLANNIDNPEILKLSFKNDSIKYDFELIKKYSSLDYDLLDLGSGTGLIVNKLIDYFRTITAVEYFKEFSDYINKEKINVINKDLLKLDLKNKYYLITMFGVAHYFNENEIKIIYNKAFRYLKNNCYFIIKNQFSFKDTKTILYSKELKDDYFAQYRNLDYEIELLQQIGFSIEEVVDIYPKEYNRWEDTHFYAIVCRKI